MLRPSVGPRVVGFYIYCCLTHRIHVLSKPNWRVQRDRTINTGFLYPLSLFIKTSAFTSSEENCRFDKDDFVGRKGVKIPLLNTKIQCKKIEGTIEKLITVENDGEKLTAISVMVKEKGHIKYLNLLNKEEITTQWGLSNNRHLVFRDYDPNIMRPVQVHALFPNF